MRPVIFTTFSLILFSCGPRETEEQRLLRELNEKLDKGNKIVDEKTKEALDKFEKLMLDSTGKIKINKIEPITFARKGYLNTGDSMQLKVRIAAYDSADVTSSKNSSKVTRPKKK